MKIAFCFLSLSVGLKISRAFHSDTLEFEMISKIVVRIGKDGLNVLHRKTCCFSSITNSKNFTLGTSHFTHLMVEGPFIDSKLLTNAKKATVSALYWYKSFPEMNNLGIS